MFSDRGNLLANSRITCTDFDRKGGASQQILPKRAMCHIRGRFLGALTAYK
jgi:hypothetical protein